MIDKESMLTQDDVYEVIQMATNIYTSVFTPSLVNQNLKNLNNNPLIPNKESLEKVLQDYKNSDELAQAFNEFAEVYDMLFKRLVSYYSGLLSFDLDYVCTNAYTPDDYNSKAYKDDKKRVAKFLDKFNYKSEFASVLKQMIRRETYFTCFRDSTNNLSEVEDISNSPKKKSSYTLQVLPQDRCMITGKWAEDKASGLLFDFDMSYFLKQGTDINSYAPSYKKKYLEVFNSTKTGYNPTSGLNSRNGTFALWTQTSPNDGNWVWKFNIDNIVGTPFLTPMIKNILTDKEVAELQMDSNMIAAKGIIAGQIPMMDKQANGQYEDAMAWNPKTLQKMLKLVKTGLRNNNLLSVALPTKDNDLYQFENKNPDMLENQISITSGLGNSASKIIYSSTKESQAELEAQIMADYQMVRKVYSQFESFLNFYINKKTKKFKFKFKLDGSTYNFIRKQEKDNLLELADRGMVLHCGSYAKILNMNPFDFERLLMEGKFTGWTEKLTSQLTSIHTQTANDVGRPKKDSSDLTESGAISREYD